jgi:hypothetical protein
MGLFLACWLLYLLRLIDLVPLPFVPGLGLTELFRIASVVGWVAGMVFVQTTRHAVAPVRRQLFLLSFFGPPSLVFLLSAMARLERQTPLVVLWSLAVFGVFYLVPVSFRSVGRRSPPR